jgi:hypothetical protein
MTQRRNLWVVVAGLALLAAIALPIPAHADKEFPFDPKRGDLEAEGPGEKKKKIAADLDRKKLCATLYPPPDKSRDKRAKYVKWVKRLICDYISADFSTPQARDAFVRTVLAALRQNAAGAWAFSAGAPVIHVVTEQPAYRKRKDKNTAGRVKKIKSQAVRRSRRQPGAAAVGIAEKFFTVPKAENLDQADQRIPQAEKLIQNILGLATVADLIAGADGAIAKKQANRRVEAALVAFRKLVLTAAEKSKFEGGSGIGPKPKAAGPAVNEPADHYTPPGPQAGRNLLIRRPAPNAKPITITKIKKEIGITRAIFQTDRLKYKASVVPASANESIEPEYKFRPRIRLRATIRTWIVIESFFGLAKNRKALPVVDRTGKSCTQAIEAHERRHIDHHWKPWRAEVVEKIVRRLRDLSTGFEKVQDPRVRLFETSGRQRIAGRKIDVANLDIVGEFVFPDKNKNGTFTIKAGKMISKAFSNAALKQFTAQFEQAANALGDKFHRNVEVGLDDDCNPVRDPKKAVAQFRKVEQKAK